MGTQRVEAFSDGVLAIIITIMVLELHIPEGNTFTDLQNTFPLFVIYSLSFGIVAVLWNNHHHLLALAETVDPKIMWMNNLLLFSISLIPFATEWLAESSYSGDTVAFYGMIMVLVSTSYAFLQREIFDKKRHKYLVHEIFKTLSSFVLFLLGILLSWTIPYVSIFLYFLAMVPWFVPSEIIEWIVKGEPKDKTYYKIKNREKQRLESYEKKKNKHGRHKTETKK